MRLKVCGNTELPIVDREWKWNAEATRDRVFKWAGWDNQLKPERSELAFSAHDGADPTSGAPHRFGFADVIHGELKAVPRGLFEVAQRLQVPGNMTDLSADVRQSDSPRCPPIFSKWASWAAFSFTDRNLTTCHLVVDFTHYYASLIRLELSV